LFTPEHQMFIVLKLFTPEHQMFIVLKLFAAENQMRQEHNINPTAFYTKIITGRIHFKLSCTDWNMYKIGGTSLSALYIIFYLGYNILSPSPTLYILFLRLASHTVFFSPTFNYIII